MECFTSVWKFSGQSTGYPTLFWVPWDCLWWKWSTSTGGPLWPVGLIRSKLAVTCQKILVSISTLPSSNQTFSQNWMDPFNLFGDFKRFPFNQKVWFAFLAENGTAFSKIFKKRTTLRGITRFSETFSGNFSLHSTLIWEFLEFLVEWFTFRKFNSLWNFWTLFWEISLQLASVSKFSKVLVEWKASFVSINVVPFSPYNFTGFCLFGFI